MSEKEKQHTFLKPFFEKEALYQDDMPQNTLTEDRDTQAFIIVPKMKLPTKSIDQWSTLGSLEAIHSPASSSFLIAEGLPFDLQPTWIMPAIQQEERSSASEQKNVGAESYATHIRKLLKSSGVYALASLASPLVSLVLSPFLTRNLSHEEYGTLAVLTTAIALLAGLTQLGLASAFFRSYNYDYESPKDRLGVLSTVVVLLMTISLPVLVISAITAPLLATMLLSSASFGNLIRLSILLVFLQNLTVPGFAWLRAETRAGFFATLSILNLFINLGTTILFVGIMHMGIAGSLLGTGSGYVVVILCTLPLILLRAGIRPRLDIAKGLLSFGLPNVSTFVSMWILQLSDRYLLSRLGSLTQTASYAVAYSLGGVLSVIVMTPFTLAWPSAMFTIAKKENAPLRFKVVFRWYSIVLLFAAFAFSLVSTAVLNLFFPPAYHVAAPIIPIIALSTMLYGVYNIFTTGISVKRKTWFAFAFTTISALVNIGLNVVLIPLYGSIGAALATVFAYVLLAIVAYIVNQRIYPIPFEIGVFIVELVLGIGLYICSTLFTQSMGIYASLGISLGILCLYGGCLGAIAMMQTRRSASNRKNTGKKFLYS